MPNSDHCETVKCFATQLDNPFPRLQPPVSEAFAGLWTRVEDVSVQVCDGAVRDFSSEPTTPYTLRMRVTAPSGVELVELSQEDLTTEYCIAPYEVAGRVATLTEVPLECEYFDEGSDELPPPLVYSRTWDASVLTLSEDGEFLNEAGSWTDSEGCEGEVDATYRRGGP